ncbi:carboxypeptidase regulatory-like domain-containing protein [Mucilaginibacter calamicampi]|uniref:Carboxypeptidase regulatory-like domain-containing protein n=1 Tax=Mucilaginibacter calamicampi TaxID=1302352 RepID=A0ABW2Z0J1_9SPHI
MKLKVFFLSIVVLSLLIGCKKEQSAPVAQKTGNLTGVITNSYGQPIEGAQVSLDSYSTVSTYNGSYSFNDKPVKKYSLTVSKSSYLTKIESIDIVENKTIEKKIVLEAGEPYLNISETTFKANPNGSGFYVQVLSNVDWMVQIGSKWISSEKTVGKGNERITISYATNDNSSNRTDTVYFISGNIKKSLVISQSVLLKLSSFEGIIGNGEMNILDSVHLSFNKPISTITIQSNFGLCVTDIKYTLANSNEDVYFSYGCAKLGDSFPFTITATDAEGGRLVSNVNVPFYKFKRTITGFITDYILVNQEKEMIIAAYNPSKLIRYSIEKDSVLQTYDLSNAISPVKLSYNPYDGKVYIMGSDPSIDHRDITVNRSDIYTLNLTSGQVVKALTINPSVNDSQSLPYNIPYGIGFTRSGHGVLLIHSKYSSGITWRLIDCTNNYAVSEYPYPISDAEYLDGVYMNFDQTKLIFTQTYTGSCNYGIFDGGTQKMSIIRPSSVTRSVFITPSRKDDKIYFGQLYDQFIMDPKGNMSQISYIDNRVNASADFSYRAGENNFIYFCEENYLKILDYSRSKTIMWCDMTYGAKKFTSTVNGKLAIAYKQNQDLTSSFYVFDINSLYRHTK